jgi:hypothetical protein
MDAEWKRNLAVLRAEWKSYLAVLCFIAAALMAWSGGH